MTCANVLVGLGKIVKGWRLAMLDGRMEVRLSASLPRRERLHHHQPVLREPCISIHAPAKGATSLRDFAALRLPFQSTLPRRERHWSTRLQYASGGISIHAPAKGATPITDEAYNYYVISIHAPAKGATAKITKTIPNDFCKINNYNNSFA